MHQIYLIYTSISLLYSILPILYLQSYLEYTGSLEKIDIFKFLDDKIFE